MKIHECASKSIEYIKCSDQFIGKFSDKKYTIGFGYLKLVETFVGRNFYGLETFAGMNFRERHWPKYDFAGIDFFERT